MDISLFHVPEGAYHSLHLPPPWRPCLSQELFPKYEGLYFASFRQANTTARHCHGPKTSAPFRNSLAVPKSYGLKIKNVCGQFSMQGRRWIRNSLKTYQVQLSVSPTPYLQSSPAIAKQLMAGKLLFGQSQRAGKPRVPLDRTPTRDCADACRTFHCRVSL